jgi:hypothetical protein
MKSFMTLLCGMACGVMLSACGAAAVDSDATLKVYRSDGSRQCEGGAISLDDMSAQLEAAGIEVLCAQQGHDGLMHPAVCGASSGRLNIFTIRAAAAERARELGFAPVSGLHDYHDSACAPSE